jgi:hypothetical protein
MRVHICPDCQPKMGPFLQALRRDDIHGTPITPEQLEGHPRAQEIVKAWKRRDVPKVFR